MHARHVMTLTSCLLTEMIFTLQCLTQIHMTACFITIKTRILVCLPYLFINKVKITTFSNRAFINVLNTINISVSCSNIQFFLCNNVPFLGLYRCAHCFISDLRSIYQGCHTLLKKKKHHHVICEPKSTTTRQISFIMRKQRVHYVIKTSVRRLCQVMSAP